MPALRFDAEQRFTCRQCGRCCRRGWDIALSPGEADAYRRARVERFYRERDDVPEGAATDPFEPIPGHPAWSRIRKRADGACGFLSKDNRCRIHEEMGSSLKPLTCRLFPFRFHPGETDTLVTASFCCPTVVKNDGATLDSQSRDIAPMAKAWLREHPESPGRAELVAGVPLGSATLEGLRSALRRMLDRPGTAGQPALREGVARMAALLEDLSRHRVTRLEPEALAEYIALVGGHAALSPRPAITKRPSALSRLLFRGFLYVVMAGRAQVEDRSGGGLRLGLRLKLARMLAHVHGLGPRVDRVDLSAAQRAPIDLHDPAVRGLAHNYLRATLAALGSGRRPLVDEMALAVAFLNAGCALAAMRAGREGRPKPDADDFAEGLMEAVDLTHADGGGIGRILGTLSGGVDSLWMLAAGGPFAAAQSAGRAAEE